MSTQTAISYGWRSKTVRAGTRHSCARGSEWRRRRFGSRAPVNEFHLTIDDTIDNLGKGILGLTVGCARCHDHKFDPIPTADYYGIYGILKSTAYPHPGTEIYPHTFGFAALNPAQSDELKKWEQDLSGLDFRIEDMKAGVHDHLMFGEGEVDFADVFAGLRAANYEGGVYVELSRHSYDAVNTARKAKQFLERFVT